MSVTSVFATSVIVSDMSKRGGKEGGGMDKEKELGKLYKELASLRPSDDFDPEQVLFFSSIRFSPNFPGGLGEGRKSLQQDSKFGQQRRYSFPLQGEVESIETS